MDKFRKIWFVIVIAATVLFLAYRVMDMLKADSSGPVMKCDSDTLEVSIYDDESVLLQGVTAVDKKDGDVTDTILLEKLSDFHEANKRIATYVAFDSDNHISKIEREIVYIDYERPRFQLTGSLRFRAGQIVNIDQIVKATDSLDGDISNKVKILMDTTINNRVTGVYNIEYEVTNSAGDTVKLPVEVEIYESDKAELDLNLKQYLVYYEGQEINYKDYLKSVEYSTVENYFEGVTPDVKPQVDDEEEDDDEEDDDDQDEGATVNGTTVLSKDSVTVRSQVNEKVPGVYPVTFYYVDNSGIIDFEATEVMYVVVE